MAEFIEPNWHVALVHFPIALLMLGVVLELVSRLAPTLRPAGRWMMLLGALAGPAVAYSGLYALNDIARQSASSPYGAWHEVTATARFSAVQWEHLTRHAYLQLGSTGVALFAACVFLGASDGARRLLYVPLLLLMLAVAGATGLGAHLAGQTVYAHGTGVLPVMGDAGERREEPERSPRTAYETLLFLSPPLELHAFLAGTVVSLGCVAIACAFRNTATLRAAAAPPPLPKPASTASLGTQRFDPPAHSQARSKPLAASRLFLLTTLAGLAAATAGWWHLANESETTSPRALYEIVMPFPPQDALQEDHREELRRPVHVALGVLVVTLPLLLALWVRLRPQGRIVLTLLGLAFLAAGTVQTGLGALLLFDETTGPLTRLNGSAHEPAPEPSNPPDAMPDTVPDGLATPPAPATQPAE